MKNKKELNPNVTRNDIISFVEHIRNIALNTIQQENEAERLGVQRKLFLDESTFNQINELVELCANMEGIVKNLNETVTKNHTERKVKHGNRLYVFTYSDNSFNDVENRFLNLFLHSELTELKEKHSKKVTETKLAYGTILSTLKGMRSPSKMGEYLLGMGFDISKIEAKTPIVKEEKPKVEFTKEVLFPCLKD